MRSAMCAKYFFKIMAELHAHVCAFCPWIVNLCMHKCGRGALFSAFWCNHFSVTLQRFVELTL